jgi:hypothetical protein
MVPPIPIETIKMAPQEWRDETPDTSMGNLNDPLKFQGKRIVYNL